MVFLNVSFEDFTAVKILRLGYGGSLDFWNVGIVLQHCMSSQPRWPRLELYFFSNASCNIGRVVKWIMLNQLSFSIVLFFEHH